MSASTLSPGNAAHRGALHDDSHYHTDGSNFDQFIRSAYSPAGGNLSVLSYSPAHGTAGTRLQVTFNCKNDIGLDVRVRLVVGSLRVTTSIDESEPPGSGSWQLDASVPSFAKARWPSSTVPLTIEAVDKDNHVLDWVRFGAFTYGDAVLEESLARQNPLRPGYDLSSNSCLPPPSLRLVTGVGSPDRSSKRKSPYNVPPTPISDSDYSSSRPNPRPPQSINQPPNVPGLRRIRQGAEQNEQNSQNAVLDILTPLESLCYNWDESELQAGRRLVRFRRVQDRNSLMVSAESISQADYDPNDTVVSCIYREETNSFCVTSVDIIHLLQRLVDAEFEVDEKNRIRRNLEGLRPTTVSKSRPGFESFFQRIMDFPDPKPRKIEKDLKVFDWKLLPQALDKIISKYSMYTSPPSISPGSREDGCEYLASRRQSAAPGSSKDERFEYLPSYNDGGSFTSAAATCPDSHLEMSQLTQLSPLAHLSPFPKEESDDSDPAQVHSSLFPAQEGPLSLVYMDPLGLPNNLDGDMAYDIHSSSDDICHDGANGDAGLRVEPAHDWGTAPQQHNHDADVMLGFSVPESSVFRTETTHAQRHGHAYSNTQGHAQTPAHILADDQVTAYPSVGSEILSLTGQYGFSGAHESIDLYSPIRYNTNPYDSFELQPREYSMDIHNGMSDHAVSMSKMNAAALAGQVAF